MLSERIGVLGQLVAVLSKNKYQPPALPRPETATDRATRAYKNERHQRLASQLLPPEEG